MTWHGTLDYIFVFKGYKQPIQRGYMTVLPLKSKQAWYYDYLKDIPADSNDGKGFYRDMSDHYPVVATFKFNM